MALWQTLAGWMNRSGLGDAPRTLLHELAKTKSGDIVLPAQTAAGVEKTVGRHFCAGGGSRQFTDVFECGVVEETTTPKTNNQVNCL